MFDQSVSVNVYYQIQFIAIELFGASFQNAQKPTKLKQKAFKTISCTFFTDKNEACGESLQGTDNCAKGKYGIEMKDLTSINLGGDHILIIT